MRIMLSLCLAGVLTSAGGAAACTLQNGDTNGDGATDVSDAVYTLIFRFLGGPEPVPFCRPLEAREGCAVENGDANGDKARDVSDVVYMLSFLFLGGNPPVEICGKEVCDNGKDDDGDGAIDCADSDCDGFDGCRAMDADGDGYTIADGDCDDADPLVNPGAYDFPDNGIDDDCDGAIDPPKAVCDATLGSHPEDAAVYAQAMDICRTAGEGLPVGARTWGLLGAELTLLDGTGTPNPAANSIRAAFGSENFPRWGSTMLLLSTGHAAAPGQVNPTHAAFQPGRDFGLMSGFPPDWLEANGGTLPRAPGCPAPTGAEAAHDPVMLALRLRVPTNARSFRFRAKFFSAEYPEWVCSPFNDFFVVLLDSAHSGAPENPADKNLAVLDDAAGRVPIGVNLATGNIGLSQDCQNGPTGCAGGAVAGTYSRCAGPGGLAGTGMDLVCPSGATPQLPGCCGENRLAGGGSAWLKIQGNVEPGEVIRLRLALWDTGDGNYDSLVLVDGFEWSPLPVEPGASAE
jgi:hypothetical protein